MGSERGESLVGLRGRVDSGTTVHGGETDNGELAHTSVLQFGFSEEVNRDEVGETERVESDITGVSRKIRRVFEERKGCAGNVSRTGIFGLFTFRSGIGSDNSGCASYNVRERSERFTTASWLQQCEHRVTAHNKINLPRFRPHL